MFTPFLDEVGILRVGGRLHLSHLPFEAKNPPILPPRHHLSPMLIEEAHADRGHSGIEETMTEVRSRARIIDLRALVRRVLSKCIVCRRQIGTPQKTPFAWLPEARVQQPLHASSHTDRNMSQQKKECRHYRDEYLKFGFVPSPANMHMPMCLICEVFSNESMKPSRRPRIDNVLTSTSGIGERDGLRASYNISLLIAKSGKPHTIDEELLLPVKFPLSNDAVQHRIDHMATAVEETLCDF
uniref:Integrase_H2C2 domain-containing protein n=1 Tax=Trichuris muris TaxID=70415 RepID=A0A5S6QBR2_TRIMR